MEINKIYGGYLTQEGKGIPVSSPTAGKMANYAVKVLKTEIANGLENLNVGEALVIEVSLAVSRTNPDPGTD